MAVMTRTGVKHILIFEALFQSELVADVNWKDADVSLSRHFRCDLTRFAIDAQSAPTASSMCCTFWSRFA